MEGLKKGNWVGIRFDEPVGQNDGTVKDRRIFECPPGHGAFVRGKNVTTGDFPERSILDELSDDGEDGGHDHAHSHAHGAGEACSHGHEDENAEESEEEDEL